MKELHDELKNKYLSNIIVICNDGKSFEARITKVEMNEGVITLQYIDHSFKYADMIIERDIYYCHVDYTSLMLDKLWIISLNKVVSAQDVMADITREIGFKRMMEIRSKVRRER